MGFFRFFDSSQVFLKYFFVVRALNIVQTGSEHNISFDLTIPHTKPIPSITQPRHATRIPLEVIMLFMDAAYNDENIELNKSMLRSFALVCRDWSMHAQRLLFRHVALDSLADYLAFKTAADRSTERGRVLGNAVRTMRVSLDPNQPFALDQLSFAHAVTLCPQLHELTIGLYGCVSPGPDIVGSPDTTRMRRPAPAFDEAALAILRSGPSIAALRFNNWSENRQSITQLLGVWPTLKSLVIGGTASPELPSPVCEPLPCALEKLGINVQSCPSVDFMRWLLHNSHDTLCSIEFEREPSTAVLQHVVESHHATLTSLALPTCSRATARVLAKCKCTSLRKFTVEDAASFPLALKELSTGVEHIGFSLNKESSMQAALEAVKANGSLQAVTVNLWNGGKLHRQLPSLKMACALRGIHLRITDDIRVFRVIVQGEHMTRVPDTLL
ncbi:hypothetical protein BDP27DRAFT_1423027 [Rhodocollybia butyracea]|uniref:Uncharacterized protein n=1 Tax=Rhodocollybia butyracea TaxID=206335 RepID=A0A9P5PQE5_9AGAR|nr:hypothetical protein BDP27DRAFT_1423027 [Rhodocollybia butyracea]